jgi:hypothetical protein
VALGATEAKEIGTLSKADYILYGTVAFRDVPADGVLVQQGQPRSAFPLTGTTTWACSRPPPGRSWRRCRGSCGAR